ncbi:hypothetical protein GI374_04360 [Paracoccus sp. S-4012]|nr:hypothetical protein [Paracoccus sp. S-4012]
MLATAVVVIGVAAAVERLGPAVGGALAGLPIVLGPGFFFLMREAEAGFVAQAAGYSILSLAATQLFLLAYIVMARRVPPLICMLASGGAWAGAALVLKALPPLPAVGMAVFAAVTFAAWRTGRGFLRPSTAARRSENRAMLVARGLLAGVLVAAVTAMSGRLGPTGSGLLMAFPVGYTVLSITIHERMGADTAAATLHSAILGTISLAGFCGALALTATALPAPAAFLAALLVSLAITTTLARRSRGR